MNNSRECSQKFLLEAIGLASAGVKGAGIEWNVSDWDLVCKLIAKHRLIPYVACALIASPNLDCPISAREYMMASMRDSSSKNMIRLQRTVQLLKEMENDNIEVMVLKGYVIAACYAYPMARESSDVDLLISRKQERRVYEFLKAKGFQISPRSHTSHHGKCQHKKFGLIEIHVQLYDELVKDVWLSGIDERQLIQERGIHVLALETPVYTLGYTDHLIFLALHLVKHFISSGISIRMMIDFGVFFSQNKDKIDVKRLWETINATGYSTVINGILQILIDANGFAEKDFPGKKEVSREQVALILDDLERGGYMGVEEAKIRNTACMEFNRQLLSKKKGKVRYTAYMIKWKIRSAISSMLLSPDDVRMKYRICNKFRWMIPMFGFVNCFAYPIRKLAEGNFKHEIGLQSRSVAHIVEQRIEMFRKLEMLQ